MTSRIKKVSDKRLKELGGKPMFSTIRKKKRPVSETVRIYGTPKRRIFVRSRDCAACGISGWSVNAHLAPKCEKGTGYKGDAKWIAPLCGTRENDYAVIMGCHEMYDEHREMFYELYPDFDPTRAAQETEKAFRRAQGEEE